MNTKLKFWLLYNKAEKYFIKGNSLRQSDNQNLSIYGKKSVAKRDITIACDGDSIKRQNYELIELEVDLANIPVLKDYIEEMIREDEQKNGLARFAT